MHETSEMPLHIQIYWVIRDSGLFIMYQQEKGEKGQARIENLEELVTATCQYSYQEDRSGSNVAAASVFIAYGAGGRRRLSRCLSGRGAVNGLALGQGAGIPAGIYRRYGRRYVPKPDVTGRNWSAGGRTQPGLRRRDVRYAKIDADLR